MTNMPVIRLREERVFKGQKTNSEIKEVQLPAPKNDNHKENYTLACHSEIAKYSRLKENLENSQRKMTHYILEKHDSNFPSQKHCMLVFKVME